MRFSVFPEMGKKVQKLISIPTTSGTGSEIIPFAVVTDVEGKKYTLCSYCLTPDIAIVDSRYAAKLRKSLVAFAVLFVWLSISTLLAPRGWRPSLNTSPLSHWWAFPMLCFLLWWRLSWARPQRCACMQHSSDNQGGWC